MTKPNQKSRMRIVGINFILFVLLFGLVLLNKEFIRPKFNDIPYVKFLIGSFPNFIAAYFICLAFINAILIRKPKLRRLVVYICSFVVFIILTIEEIKPMWGASTCKDSYDILASGLGSILAILTFELFYKRRTNENK
jgi:hypothetical protein